VETPRDKAIAEIGLGAVERLEKACMALVFTPGLCADCEAICCVIKTDGVVTCEYYRPAKRARGM